MSDAFYAERAPVAPVEGRPLPPAQDPGLAAPEADRERLNRAAGALTPSRGLALREAFGGGMLSEPWGFLYAKGEEALGLGETLSAEEANAQYGVPGRLSFSGPTTENMAQWRSGHARREAFREDVLATSDVGPLERLGAGLAGSILDPASAPLWLIPEVAAGRVIGAGLKTTRLGPIARGTVRGAGEGVAGGLLIEGVNLWQHHELNDDYDFGEASLTVLAGGVLGGVIGAGGGWWEGRAARRGPTATAGLSEEGQLGAFALALDDVIEDRPVDLTPVLKAEVEHVTQGRVPAAARLDDGDPVLFEGARAYDADVAVTTTGREIPVRYAVFEADDLVTSHDDDLFPNGQYPQALQPRDRGDRAGSKAYNVQLESRMNPKLLVRDVAAAAGAPIGTPDGVIESGNGRTIALRRNGRNGGALSQRYRAELEARGYDTTGFRNPVLVRVRTEPLTGAQRVALAREMNDEVTEAMSASERAAADVAELGDDVLGLLKDADLSSAANRPFVRKFLDKVAGSELNALTTSSGELSTDGLRRVQAALVFRAYGDKGLVETLFEASESQIKAIGQALAKAAPEWAAMRAAMARGEVPAELDVTPNLTAAVAFVRQVRARKGSIEEAVGLMIDQVDAFDGVALSVETEAFVRAFFRTSADGATLWRSPRGAEGMAEGLRWLARETMKAQPGPNLFGEVADESSARRLLDGLGQWFARRDDPDGDDLPSLFGPGAGGDGNDGGGSGGGAPDPAGGNVRPDGQGAGRKPGGPEAGEDPARVEARPIVTRETLWERSPEELEALWEEAKASDQEKLVLALGEEGAKEFKRLDRAQNNSFDTARADAAAREFEAKFGDDKLTPDQQRLIYGVGEVDATADEIKQVLDAHGDLLPDDPEEWAAYMGAVGVRGATVEELMAVPRGEGSPTAQAAFIRLQAMGDYFAAQGVSANELPRRMAEALMRVGGWKADQAAEIVGGFVEAMTAGRTARRAEDASVVPEKPRIPKGTALPAPQPPKGQPFADPEVAALAVDTDAMLAREGLTDLFGDDAGRDPQTVADAVAAAAFCLAGGE